MILSKTEIEYVFSDQARKLRDEYSQRHGEPAPGYNPDEFSSLEEWIAVLKS